MLFFIEAICSCLFFTTILVISFKQNPFGAIDDFPPAVGKYIRENNIKSPDIQESFKCRVTRKGLSAILIIIVFGIVIKYVNKGEKFMDGFLVSYGLWNIVNLYDLIVIDWILCTHCKKFRIPGTEEHGELYKGYWFHAKKSLIGVFFGIPISAFVGIVVNHLK